MVVIFSGTLSEHGQRSHQCWWQGWLAFEQVRLDEDHIVHEVQTDTCQLAPSGPQDFQPAYALWIPAMKSQVQVAPK